MKLSLTGRQLAIDHIGDSTAGADGWVESHEFYPKAVASAAHDRVYT